LPQNYFDDLSVRYDLGQGELRRLYETNVMYDADADGEFLHACTDTFEDRFFFEIVERRRGYTGFGGLDAMVRTVLYSSRAMSNDSPSNRNGVDCRKS
jgi:4-hydroxyphenylpyruvate dioxygenase